MERPVEQRDRLRREEDVDDKEKDGVERTEGRWDTVCLSSLPSTLLTVNRSMVCINLTIANLSMVLDATLASAARGGMEEVEDDGQIENTTLKRRVSGGLST
jgi:hypothetical protein